MANSSSGVSSPYNPKYSSPERGLVGSVKGFYLLEIPKASLNTDYVNVPILANVKLHEKFSLQAGPQFGFLVVKPEIGSEEPIFGGENYLDKGIYRTFDFAVVLGFKIRFTDNIAGELRYTNSLTNLFDKKHPALEAANFGNNNNFRHSYFSFGVEYRIKQLTIF